MKRASVTDVSRRAGVSTATVSRVLNAPEKVSESTRERVLEAIKALNFVKSATAFSLKAQQSHNVLVVVSNIGNIFYSKMFQGVQLRAEESGYSVIISSRASGPEHPVLERLRTGRVDGVIVLDPTPLPEVDTDFLETFYRQDAADRRLFRKPGLLPYPHILVDNFKPSYEITRYLIDLGHRDIAVVQAPDYLRCGSNGLAAFKRPCATPVWRCAMPMSSMAVSRARPDTRWRGCCSNVAATTCRRPSYAPMTKWPWA